MLAVDYRCVPAAETKLAERGSQITVSAESSGDQVGRVAHVLLFLTLLLIAVQPIGTVASGIYARLVFGAVIVGCIAVVYGNRRLFIVGLVLGIPALGIIVVSPPGGVGSVGLVLGIAVILFVCFVLLRGIFISRGVTAASVSASLVVYLLLGIVWWMAYVLAETQMPGSFYGLSGGDFSEIRRDLFYYSYVTLTTLGYGDIGPVGESARSLAMMQAVVGQLYLVVLVASLVSLFLRERSKGEDE